MNSVLRPISIAAAALITCIMSCCATTASVVVVPCGVQTDYYIDTTANGTTYLLQNCTDDVGTVLNLRPNGTSVSDTTIILENSRRVAVQIQGNSLVDLIGLQVTINNVTNDLDESKVQGSVVCPVATGCAPLISLLFVRNIVNSTVAVTNVLHQRNQSIIAVGNVSAAQNMTLIATKSSMLGFNRVIVVANVSDQMVDCLVSLSLVSFVLLQPDGNSSLSMFLLSDIRLVRTFRISIANATATSGGIFAAQFLSAEYVSVNLIDTVASGNQSRLLFFLQLSLNGSRIDINNATCTTEGAAVTMSNVTAPANDVALTIANSYIEAALGVYLDYLHVTSLQITLSATTLSGYQGQAMYLSQASIGQSVIVLHDVTCVAPQTALVLNNSSALNSSIVVSNLMSVVTNASSTFYGGLFYCFAASLQQFSISIDHSVVVADDYPMYLAYADTQSILDDVTMSVNNSTVSGNQSHLIRFAEVTLNNVSINISNVTCSSQLVAIQMDGQQRHVNNVALTITHSYIAAAFAVRLQSFNATSFSLVVAATTLRIVNSSNLTNYLDALYCFNGSFSDSSLVFDSVRTISDAPSLPQAGQMVQFREFTLAKTTVIIFLTTLEGSGGIIAVWSTVVDQSSTLRVQVAANIDVAPSFGRAIVYIYKPISESIFLASKKSL